MNLRSAKGFTRQLELSYISDFDGAFNFVIGYYDYYAKAENKYSDSICSLANDDRHVADIHIMTLVFRPTLARLKCCRSARIAS
jgi:hypothetical protein